MGCAGKGVVTATGSVTMVDTGTGALVTMSSLQFSVLHTHMVPEDDQTLYPPNASTACRVMTDVFQELHPHKLQSYPNTTILELKHI